MDVAAAFLAHSRYLLREEYPVKLRRCLAALPPAAVWARPNDASNSVGNLLLHLAGNVRQWIASGVGGAPDDRYRAAEFTARDGPTADALLAGLEAAIADADRVLAGLDAAALLERRTIQGREVTVLEAVYHVVEHFSMHTGQIIMLTKMLTASDLRFYEFEEDVPMQRWLK